MVSAISDREYDDPRKCVRGSGGSVGVAGRESGLQ